MPKLNAAQKTAQAPSPQILEERNSTTIDRAEPMFAQVNSNWEKVESYLKAKGVLHSVEHSFGQLEKWLDPGTCDTFGDRLIGIQRVKGKWRVCYGTFYYCDPNGETDWTPITECSMEIRIELLEHVPKLFEALVVANEKYIPTLEKAVEKSNEVLKNLGIS